MQSILSVVEGCGRGGTSLAKLDIERILRRGAAPNAQNAFEQSQGAIRNYISIVSLPPGGVSELLSTSRNWLPCTCGPIMPFDSISSISRAERV